LYGVGVQIDRIILSRTCGNGKVIEEFAILIILIIGWYFLLQQFLTK
jgi:hypothetical protein